MNNALQVKDSKPKVRFDPKVPTIELEHAYSQMYGTHPRESVISGPIGSVKVIPLPAGHDPYTGIPKANAEKAISDLWVPTVTRCELILIKKKKLSRRVRYGKRPLLRSGLR